MPRPNRTPFWVRMRTEWSEFRESLRRWIYFRKVRFKRFLKARRAKQEDRLAKRNAPPLIPEGANIRQRADPRQSKIKRLRADFSNDLQETRFRFKQWRHFRWMRVRHFFQAVRTRLADMPSIIGFFKYLLHKRQRSIREQESLSTRKMEAKASSWSKFRSIYLPEWLRRWTIGGKPKSVLLAFLLLTSLVLGLAAVPIYAYLKDLRAQQLLDNSRELHEEGRTLLAFRKAHASYMLKPTSIEILRWLCDSAESIGYHELLAWRQKLVSDQRSKSEDRVKLIRTALAFHRPKVAEAMILSLNPSEMDRSEYRFLRLLTTLALGRSAKLAAINQCREILRSPDAPLEANRIYWSLCLDSLDPRFHKEGIDHMERMAQKGGDLSLLALRFLLRLPNQDLTKRNLYAQLLWEHPSARRNDLLLSLKSAFWGKSLPEQSLQAALDKKYDRLDYKELKEISSILNDLGLHENAQELIQVPEIEDDKELWAEWMRAAIQTNKRNPTRSIIREDAPFSESERRFLHSLILRQNGKEADADYELQESLRLAQPSDFPILRKFVLLHEDSEALIALLMRLAKEPGLGRWANPLLVMTLQRTADAEPLEEVLTRMQLVEYSDDPETANRVSRLKALHGQDLHGCRKVAEQLVAQYPNIREYRFTLALIYQECDRPREALRLLQDMLPRDPPTKECPTQRIIGARALLSNGFPKEANILVAGLDNIKLLPAEKRILEDVLAKLDKKKAGPINP